MVIGLRTGHSLPSAWRARKEHGQPPNVSFTPSTTRAVPLFNVFHVRSPTFRTLPRPARARLAVFRVRRLEPDALVVFFLDLLVDADFRAGFFAREAFLELRFFRGLMGISRVAGSHKLLCPRTFRHTSRCFPGRCVWGLSQTDGVLTFEFATSPLWRRVFRSDHG